MVVGVLGFGRGAGAALRAGSGAVSFGDAGWLSPTRSLFHDATLTIKVINAKPCLPGVAVGAVKCSLSS